MPNPGSVSTLARGEAARSPARSSSLSTQILSNLCAAHVSLARMIAAFQPLIARNETPWNVACATGQHRVRASAVVKIVAEKCACTMSGRSISTSRFSARAARRCATGFIPRGNSM